MAAELALVRELAAAADYLAVLAVARADGTVHGSLVKAGVLADPASGRDAIGVVVAGSARKLTHLRRSGRGTVVITHHHRWVSIEGTVRLEGPDDPPDDPTRSLPELLRAVYVAAGGTHDDWDTFDRVMAEDRRTAVLLDPRRILTN